MKGMLPSESVFENALEDARSLRRQKKLDADDQGEIWGILNQDGELVRLDEPIEVTPAIERWMHQLESSMK